jgi:membrane protein implicated in regulation of membrane protease activity
VAGFIVKVMVLSVLLSIGIKYGGPFLPISANATTALIAVLLPSTVLAIVLGWRWQRYRNSPGSIE